ncbi:hypothetical protein J2847_006590 [Azospirillum agricola]|uniref:hypothetical protein n=1 Tax=Azospirillum agricola TaxID=1720247 RepID=UPI001AE3F3EB|nr:hypothetical protein [Azospirillum agricola]MBP2233253.1 hypothetical protein [Azospirillum agricola]
MRMAMTLATLFCASCVAVPQPLPMATPVAPPMVGVQQQCREFDTPVVIGGKPQQAHGTACLQADGGWQVMQSIGEQPPQSYEVQPRIYEPYYPPGYLSEPWFYGPPLFLGGVFIGGGWGRHHSHSGWHGVWRGGYQGHR